MTRSCRADALVRLRASVMKLRDGRGGPAIDRERRLFAGGGARATRILLIAIVFLPVLAYAYSRNCWGLKYDEIV